MILTVSHTFLNISRFLLYSSTNNQAKMFLLRPSLIIASLMASFHGHTNGVATAQIMADPPTVTKRVVPIPGSSDFTIEVTVTGAGGETSTSRPPVIAVSSLDRSGSMSGTKIQSATQAAIAFVDELDPAKGDLAGVISWASSINTALSSSVLTSDFEALKTLIGSTSTGGGTNLNAGLNGAISLLDTDTSTNSLKVILFLTDGSGTYTSAASGGPASIADTKGYVIYAIGVGSGAAVAPLEDMADATGGLAYPNISPENLEAIFLDIFQDVISSTVPRTINVEEITQDYIVVDCSTVTPAAASCETDAMTGQTTVSWEDIGTQVDGTSLLAAGETVTLSFRARSTRPGMVPVNDPDAEVSFEDSSGNEDVVPIPQAFVPDSDKDSKSSKSSKSSKASKASKSTRKKHMMMKRAMKRMMMKRATKKQVPAFMDPEEFP